MPQYRRLSFEEREEISRGLAAGESVRRIAKRLGRAASTISRETHRGKLTPRTYRASNANGGAKYWARKRRLGKRKLLTHPKLWNEVYCLLLKKWSPKQVEERLTLEYPEDMTMRISAETIYTYIYIQTKGTLRKQLIQSLRQEHKYRRKRKSSNVKETRGKLADMLSIERRPKEVEDRIVPGHWEGDLVLGKHKQSAIGTLVERKTRFAILVPLKAKDASTVRKAFARAVKRLPQELVKTLTYDQGKEMGEHKLFTKQTNIQVYFAHPSSPWERGTNENTNGLVRQFFPKDTDFTKVSARELKQAQHLLNGRPRQTLKWRTPAEEFNKLLR